MTGCHLCNSDDATSSFDGCLINGGFGRFDQVSLVYITKEPSGTGRLCDDCLGNLIDENKIEIYDEPGFFESGRQLGAEAYSALFRAGAGRVHVRFHELNGARLYSKRPLGHEGRMAIRNLASLISGDDTWSDQSHVEKRAAGQHAISAGEAYAICAISLGYGEEDPGFAKEAALWSAKRIEIDAMIEANRQAMFGPVL
ncbi:hypothetical protein KUV57_11885 [Epibacterium sp. DP7N7-1]|nr:hypothetical protein [Epibacterium sp. DP7N7-1]